MNNTSRGGGIGFPGALFLLFLTLKLTDTIDWSWWWITAPLWIPTIITTVVVVLFLVVAVIRDVISHNRRRKIRAKRGLRA